jgi:hypothetical protein
MKNRIAIFLAAGMILVGLPDGSGAASKEQAPKVGPVRLNPHPTGLEGKTVVLRWNGKYNGDKFLLRAGELFNQQAKGIRIIRMWEMDKETAAISKNGAISEDVAGRIGKLKADLVIAAQAD